MSEAPKFSLDSDSLRKRLGEATYARAREVYILQKVRDGFEAFASGAQAWHFIGLVEGSHRELYETEVDAEITPWGDITAFSSECTCPAPSPCKHAGALVLKAAYRQGTVTDGSRERRAAPKFPILPGRTNLQNLASMSGVQSAAQLQQNKEARAVEQWLDLFGAGDEQEALIVPGKPFGLDDDQDRLGSGQDRLVVMVQQGHKNNASVLMLSAAIAREKVQGGWGKSKAIKPWEEFKQPQEQEILSLVRGLSRAGNSYGIHQSDTLIPIAGASGWLALELAVKHGCLFLSDDGKTLGACVKLGSKRSLTWRWHEITTAGAREVSWRLKADAPDATVFHNEPPLYWDAVKSEIGQLDAAGIAPERLNQLLKSPPIPQSAWQQHEQMMLRHLAGLPLPPFAKPPREIRGITPQPTLTILKVPPQEQARFGLVYITLHFAYGDVHFFSHRQGSPVLHSPKALEGAAPDKVLLHRDLIVETQAISFLHHQGLQGNVQGQFYLPTALSDGMKWVRWADEAFVPFEQAGFRVLMEESLLQWVQRAENLEVNLRAQNQAPQGTDSSNSPGLPEETSASAWFDLSLGIEVAGERINILPVMPALIAQLRSLQAQHAGDAAAVALPEFVYVPRGQGWLRL
jgi:hypothetical protein